MEETQERKKRRTDTDGFKKSLDRVHNAFVELHAALDEMWEQDRPMFAMTYSLYSMNFIRHMNERLRMVKKELEQMENAE